MSYAKLALSNLRKNHRAYLPFLISMLFLVAILTMTQLIVNNKGMEALSSNSGAMTSLFTLGRNILVIFSVIFSLYTNSFLLKQRKKELGMYNILGLGKRELYRLMFWETLFSFLVTVSLGIFTGLVLSRFSFLVLKKLFDIGEKFIFSISIQSIFVIVLVFIVIFILLFLINCWQVKRTNPIQLLHGGKKGEKEPKARVLITLLGLLALGGGYWIALTIQSPLLAFNNFFIAVLLVILGTYLLFISGSITLLKFLKKRKKYYYQPNHFISVSNMIYRMKQNAAGLASICILSTMVLVTVSVTASLYAGEQAAITAEYPNDLVISTSQKLEDVNELIQQTAKEKKTAIKKVLEMRVTSSFGFFPENGKYRIPSEKDESSAIPTLMSFTSEQEYKKITGKSLALAQDEVALFPASGTFSKSELTFENEKFRVKKVLDTFPGTNKNGDFTDSFVVIFNNQEMIDRFLQEKFPNDNKKQAENHILQYDFVEGNKNQRLAAASLINERLLARRDGGISFKSKDVAAEGYRLLFGGFLFLGIIFGLVFTFGVTLIIYYKQVSEGMEDQERFNILQQVGMSHQSVKKVIQSQVRLVFFFPLVVALIHLSFAFPLMKKMLILFKLNKDWIFPIACLVISVIFSGIYFLVYKITARRYYQLVERN